MNRYLEQLLGWLVGVAPSGSGEGVQLNLRYSWPLPAWLTLILTAAVVALVVGCYWTERGALARWQRALLAFFRLAALGLLVFMLAQVMISQSRTGLPYVVVLLDDSASMGIEDRFDDEKLIAAVKHHLGSATQTSAKRFDLARALLLEDDARLLRTIGQHYKLKVYLVSDAARPQEGDIDQLVATLRVAQPTGASSRLGAGVYTALNDLRGAPPTALVLLSDGINTDGQTLQEAAAYARRKNVPLFTVAVGSPTPVRDLELADLLVDEVVFVDDVVNFECKLTGSGLAGRRVEVRLREKDNDAPLATVEATVGADGKPQKVRVPYRPTKVGQFEYVVEVKPLGDEINPDNNTQQRLVTVRKEQVRTLLVQSYPNFEVRYLKHMLQRDSTIALSAVLQQADLEYADIDHTALRVFPERKDELFEYDVVIFGDVDPAFFSSSALTNLAAFVTQKGGGIVFLAGPQFTPHAYRDTPLAPLFPVDLSNLPEAGSARGYKAEPTELGATMPMLLLGDTPEDSANIWRQLPPLYWLYEAPTLKPGARVLAQARFVDRTAPLVALQYVNSGKVLFHATDETWRWRWRVGDVYFARYWVQTLRYLARAKLLGKDRAAELTADRREYRRGESVRLRVRFFDDRAAPADTDEISVMIEQEGQPNRRLSLHRHPTHRGIYEGIFSGAGDGKYHAWFSNPAIEGTAAADFRIVAPPGEFERLQLDVAEMKQAADDTKGRSYTLADADRLLDDLPQGHEVPIESLPPKVLWNDWRILLGLLTMLVAEWGVRKWRGLI